MNQDTTPPAPDGAAATPPPPTTSSSRIFRFPIIEESARVTVETVETGQVRVIKEVEEWLETLSAPLTETRVEVERVAVGREVAEAPPVRQEGDVMVISVVREEAVVVTRLVLVEEVRIRRTSTVHDWQQPVPLRAETVRVERHGPGEAAPAA